MGPDQHTADGGVSAGGNEAFACRLAAGSASCLQWGGADFTLQDLHAMLAKIRFSHLTRRWTIEIP